MSRPVPVWLSILGVAFILLACGLTANAAEAVLKAPASFPACQLVILEATGSKGDSHEWTCSEPDVRCWTAPDKLSTVVWVPSPKRVVFILKSSDKAGHDVAYVVCDVTGDAPAPMPVKPVVPTPPGPRPINPPKPGRFNLAPAVYSEALKVSHADHSKQAVQVSESLKTVRSRLVAGGIDTSRVGNILEAISGSNGTLPGKTRTAWKAWGQWWGGQVKILYDAGRLKTSQDWADMLDETCAGLVGI